MFFCGLQRILGPLIQPQKYIQLILSLKRQIQPVDGMVQIL